MPAARPWSVRLHPSVAKIVSGFDIDSRVFRPSIRELLEQLRAKPKAFAKKQGVLKNCRAVRVAFDGRNVWRAVFTLDERTRTVTLLAFGPHDRAYADAHNRL